MNRKKVIIIGAGPGGLAASMILSHKGYEVIVLEKNSVAGGRNSILKLGDFDFELGPTFVMLPDIFRDLFDQVNKNLDDYIELIKIDPLYDLKYANGKNLKVYFDKQKLKQEIAKVFPGEEKNYDLYMEKQKVKFERLFKCLTIPYLHWYNYFRKKFIKAIPILGLGKSVFDNLSEFFKEDDFKIAMAFQAKYLGMSPWDCPAGFTILSYAEHAYGIYHPKGGVHKISEGMRKVSEEYGTKIFFNHKVKEIIFDNKKAIGVLMENGDKIMADHVIVNADFAYAMTNLIDSKKRNKYSDKNLEKRGYSCSTFMIYLGLKKKYDTEHHTIYFSADYKKNTDEIYKNLTLPEDPSFYVQNATVTDDSLAPKDKSTIYILAPVPNLTGKIDWDTEKEKFADLILNKLENTSEFKDIRENIEVIKIITPLDWKNSFNVYNGAVFNLAHSLDQMLYLRPRNKLEGYQNLYIVGGGTHPGSGLPTIVESGRISAELILKEDSKK
jgi:phytoene desaturase